MDYGILSFDIGIKNLSYCLLKFNIETNEFVKIDKWGIINLQNFDWMPENHEKKCQGLIKRDNSKCLNLSVGWVIKDMDRLEVCNKHKSFFNEKFYPYDLKSSKCDICGDKGRKVKLFGETLKEKTLKVCCNNCCKKQEDKNEFIKINELVKLDDSIYHQKLYNSLINLGLEGVDEVVIENQPAFKNPKMKSIQMFVYSFYFIKNIEVHNIKGGINFFNATKKLDICDMVKKLIKGDVEINIEDYKDRKTSSVEIVKKILEGEWMDFFMKNVKKDDLADSFLQGLAQWNKNIKV